MKPIIFSTWSVKAILEGRKTMTRRIIKPQPDFILDNTYFFNKGEDNVNVIDEKEFIKKSKYQIGDILYVRETWLNDPRGSIDGKSDCFYYKANLPDPNVWKGWWKPSIFMPKKAARIFLEVTNVNIERLQNISDQDCLKEGVERSEYFTLKEIYQSVWKSLHGEIYWNENPFVWVYEFIVKEIK